MIQEPAYHGPQDAVGRTGSVILGTAFWSVLVSAGAFLALGLVAAGPLAWGLVGDAAARPLVEYTLATAALMALGDVPRSLLRADRRVRTLAVYHLVKLAATIGLTIWRVVGLERGVAGVVEASLLAECLFLPPALVLAGRSLWGRFQRSAWSGLLAYGLPLLPHKLLMFALVLFGQYVVRAWLGLEQAGLYDLAIKFGVPLGLVIGAIQEAWLPYKFQVHASGDDPAGFFRATFTYYTAGVSYLWVGVSLWGPEALRLMTEPAFHAAAPLVGLAALFRLLTGIYFMVGSGIELSDNTRPMPLVSLGGLATMGAAAWLLVPCWGAAGAALATSLGWLAMAAAAWALARRRFPVAYEWPVVLPLGLAAGLAVALSGLVQDQDPPARLGVAAALTLAYPLFAWLLLLRGSDEGERLRRLCASGGSRGGR